MFDLIDLALSLGATVCATIYATAAFFKRRGKGGAAEAARLRGVLDEAHQNVRELQVEVGDHVDWESKQHQGWLRVHQLASKALKEYGPEDAYRGQGAPGREQLLEIRSIASAAFMESGPAIEKQAERDVQDFIDGKME